MGLSEMRDMEFQLELRGGGRHDNHPIACCPECMAAQREYGNRINVGVVPYRRHPWWDKVAVWLQIAVAYGVLVWLVMYAPQQCREFSQWLSR